MKYKLSEEERKRRSDNMKRVREKYYESLSESERYEIRSRGGKLAQNRYKFNSETAKKAAEDRWSR